MKNIRFFIVIFLLLSASCTKDIIDFTCTIEGIVKDEDTGTPIKNCEIQIMPSNKSVITASDGFYSFNALESGEYTLTYNRSGYISDSRTVRLNAGETSKIEMLLKAKASFSLSENIYDFGDLESNRTFFCFNNSASDCSYTISNLPEWALCSKAHGTIKANSNDSFIITIDRSKVGIGTYNQNIIIEYSGKDSGTENLLIKIAKVELSSPTVTTAYSATSITESSFEIEGSITATGGSQIISYGHCWNTEENPTIYNNCTNLGITDKTGSFKSTIEDLPVNTTFYVRAYATNSKGTAYGEQIIVKTKATDTEIPWDGQIASSFAGGTGTFADPYIIKNGGQLLLIKEYKYEYFKLANNIDLNNKNWQPFEFNGYLDGNGNSIYNLMISRKNNNQGLFSVLTGTVENLSINGVDINAPYNSNIGTLAGTARNAIINNCNIIINKGILGKDNIGGMVGIFYGPDMKITNCKISQEQTGTIKGSSYIGGIIGYIDDIDYYDNENNNNYVNINIQGESYIGGNYGYLADNTAITIYNHSYKGNINGKDAIGGIIGYIGGSIDITACKTNVEINVMNSHSDSGFGGIIGKVNIYPNSFKIICCYSTGNISFSGFKGGIVDYKTYESEKNDFSIIHCYTTINDGIDYSIFEESTTVYETENVSQTMAEYYSRFSEYWNYNNTWIWNGKVNDKQISVSCPKLSWE